MLGFVVAIRRVLTLTIALCMAATSVPAYGQDAEDVQLRLVRQPVWHEPGDDLGLTLSIFNRASEPLEGFSITVAAHSRVLSRSELHASFDGPPTFEASLITALEAPERSIPAGGSELVTIDQSLSELQSLAGATENGVYPVTISLFDGARGTLLDSLTTPLIFFVPGPEELPLHAALVIPLNEIPRGGPDGAFHADEDTGSWPLEAAVADGGWLAGLVGAIDSATGLQPRPPSPRRGRSRRGRPRPQRPPRPRPVHTAIAPMPRLLEELQDLANGYERVGPNGTERVRSGSTPSVNARDLLARIDGLMATSGIQPLLAPYSYPDLPALQSQLGETEVASQIHEAESVLENTLTNAPGRDWILAPGGRLDRETLEQLQLAPEAGHSVFLAEDSLEPLTAPAGSGCPDPPVSFTCPIRVETGTGTADGYALDPALQPRLFELSTGEDTRLMLQRFFAETSSIREEAPGREGRVVAMVLPPLWYPNPAASRVLMNGLRDAPWLRTVTPNEGLRYAAQHLEPFERQIRSEISPLEGEPDVSYFESIEEAETSVDDLAGVQPPPELVQRLTRNTLVSHSRLWWTEELIDRGESYAEEAAAEADGELGKITIGRTDEIVVPSRQAPVKVVVFNDADYPVRVDVRVSSSELDLDRTFEETVQARGLRQIEFDVAAEASGLFSLLVSVETPEGRVVTSKKIRIQSTEFNDIALGLTFGALAFLVLFYITRAARRRRSEGSAEAAP